DGSFGLVMDELAALVEEGGVVFIALDDDPFAFCKACALGKISRDAADEKTGVQAIMLKDPGEQRGGRGFAVRAADDDRTFATDEKFAQQFRQRTIRQFVIEDLLGFGIATRDSVADDD